MTHYLTLLAILHASPDLPPVSGIPYSFEPIIQRYSAAYLVPTWLCRRVAFAESSWRPRCLTSVIRNGRHIVSRGLFQINRDHERELATKAGILPWRFDWRNPDDSAHVGVAYLGRLIRKYHGDLRKAVAAYNVGPGWMDSGRPLPAETVEYQRRVLR
jgi:soluble lytic murein transglycosylase-like protein